MSMIKGDSENNILFGTNSNDTIYGYAGDDTLNGNGGTDSLRGGVGNDLYYVNNNITTVVESAGEGTADKVISSISYTLTKNVEILQLAEGAGSINATGNSANNILIGNEADNALDGKGGADQMAGGFGNDKYVVDNVGDIVSEDSDAGIDTVQSSISYALTANVENLTLTGSAVSGTGNALNNIIIGNNGSNVLDGGAGADEMRGGTGNDSYFVDDIHDVVIENAKEGTDTVNASVNYALTANVENLILTGNSSLKGEGNELQNQITANDAGDALYGYGNKDILIGGTGNDFLDGGADRDSLRGNGGNDRLEGNADIDTALYQGVFSDYSFFRNADNSIVVQDKILGRDGTDTLSNIEKISFNGVIYDVKNLSFSERAPELFTANGEQINFNEVLDTDYVEGSQYQALGGDDVVFLPYDQNEAREAGFNPIHWFDAGDGNDVVNGGISDFNLLVKGGAGNDYLSTGSGNDELDGGTGIDNMVGGEGDDVYYADVQQDNIYEGEASGFDVVYSSANMFVLKDNIEKLVLTEGSNASIGYGNGSDNELVGNSLNNTLDGFAGADRMIGGDGNDMYMVDNIGDVIIENADGGTDAVQSTVSYELGNNVEYLYLISPSLYVQSSAVIGTGNASNNYISGSNLNNILDGGLGTDKLLGNGGDDILKFSADASTTIDGVNYNVTFDTFDGGVGIDSLQLTDGNDYFENTAENVKGIEKIDAGAGDDLLVLNQFSQLVTINGGAGNDTLELSHIQNPSQLFAFDADYKALVIDNNNDGIFDLNTEKNMLISNDIENILGTTMHSDNNENSNAAEGSSSTGNSSSSSNNSSAENPSSSDINGNVQAISGDNVSASSSDTSLINNGGGEQVNNNTAVGDNLDAHIQAVLSNSSPDYLSMSDFILNNHFDAGAESSFAINAPAAEPMDVDSGMPAPEAMQHLLATAEADNTGDIWA